jgi:SAM-dependent methyltransferase
MSKAANFDNLARVYRWMEYLSFGPLLMRCREEFLPQMTSARRGLILGDGDGRFTARLLRANKNIQVDAVDASPTMLRALVQAAGENAARIQTHCADLSRWQPIDAKYDQVVSHFVLDCFSTEEVQELVKRLLPVLEKNTLWVVSEFAIPEAIMARIFARILVGFLYLTFGMLTGLVVRELPDHAVVLRAMGFELLRLKTRYFGVLRSELWRYSSNA